MRSRICVLTATVATAMACNSGREPAAAPETAGRVCPTFVLASTGLPADGEWRTHPAVGDLNGDGLDDIAGLPRKRPGPRAFLSDGLGGWIEASAGLEYSSGFSCGVGTRFADLDQDGFLDLVLGDHCQGVIVYRGDGGKTWTPASGGIPRNLSGFNDADVGDIDGDGILDIVAISAFTRGFLALQGRTDGTWRVMADTGLPTNGHGWEVRLADLNGDERLDVLCSFSPTVTDRRSGPTLPAKAWIQTAAGTFRAAEGFDDDARYFGVTTWPREGRPNPDLILAVTGAYAGLYRYEGDAGGNVWTSKGRLDEEWLGDRRRAYGGVTTVDIDNDGCLDLLTNEAGTRTVLVALGDCQGGFEICPETTVPVPDVEGSGWGLTTGDFNGDGRLDLVAGYGTASGGLQAWLQTDPSRAQPAPHEPLKTAGR